MRLLIVLLVAWSSLAAEDRWFIGTLNGQQLASLRQSERPLADGGCESSSETLLVLRRAMPGQAELRLEIREAQILTEDGQGRIIAFRFDHDENGSVTSARGTVADGKVSGTLSRLGRTTPITLAVPVGGELLGDHASQQRLVAAKLASGATLTLSSLALLGNEVRIVASTATGRGVEGAVSSFEVVVDAMPLPMQVRLDARGGMVGMVMHLGPMALVLAPAPGPVALMGAELPPTGLVQATGPHPSLTRDNRLRLPTGATLPDDPFQEEADGIVTLHREAVPAPLVGGFLAAGPQLELDDPALRAWVAANCAGVSILDDAERLRLAVRSHITTKDLSKGDGSALETFRSHTGDCTEHATLLCAALRIARIPARIVVGLIYVPEYGGWVGHAWNSAYVADRWVHLDSAYPGVPRSCYLALGHGGDSDGGGTGAQLMVQLNRLLGKTIDVLP